MNNTEAFKKILTDFFINSGKTTCGRLGVEFEHFLIDKKTMKSFRYDQPNGQHDLLKSLLKSGWRNILEENGNLLGVEKDGNTITLEPGGQVEISLRTEGRVNEIEKIYRNIAEEIKSLLKENQALSLLGYHPKTKIDELPLLPKARYSMMYDYFGERGCYAHNMMKGTASTQVSIDYHNEEDFIRKFRTANFLSPFISRIFDSTPIFEGEIYDKENCRINIWENTDSDRSKLVPGSLDKLFGFSDYADYILETPPILAHANGRAVFTKGEKLSALLEQPGFDSNDYLHYLTMVFPDVRVKNFIEIRMADAIPFPYNIALPALIKGIFYYNQNLDRYYQISRSFCNEDIRRINSQLLITSDLKYKDIDITGFSLEMIDNAQKVLDEKEASYLLPLKQLIKEYGSMAKKLKALYSDYPDAFVAEISV